MTIHAFKEYLKYRWKAKNRHGIHSPFVYAFVEDVLEDRKRLFGSLQIVDHGLPTQNHNMLLSRMMVYYSYHSIRRVASIDKAGMTASCDLLLLHETDPRQWKSLLDENASFPGNDSVVVIADIHKSADHTAAWASLCKARPVRIGIDLYGIGLLFFRAEVKERQHFVLRLPGL